MRSVRGMMIEDGDGACIGTIVVDVLVSARGDRQPPNAGQAPGIDSMR